MPTNTIVRKDIKQACDARQAFIPDDLSYLTDTEFGREMTKLVQEITAEQGTRTTEEINRLLDFMRGSVSADVDLS